MVCFNRSELMEIGLRSVFFAFPGLMLLGSVRLLYKEIHPQSIYGCSIEEPGAQDFIITNYTETELNKIIEFFIQKLPENLRTASLKNRYVTDLKDFRTMVLDAAKALKCKKMDVGFSFSDDAEWAPMEPYTAVGGQALSYRSNPFMSFHLNTAIEAKNLRERVQPFSTNAKKFISSHEVGHIASNHTLAQAIVTFAYGLFNTILWRQCWNKDYSLRDTLGIAVSAAFIHQLFFCTLVRYQEKQADLRACDALGSNQEGLEFFGELLELRKGKREPCDPNHPPIPERIAYLKAWKLRPGK